MLESHQTNKLAKLLGVEDVSNKECFLVIVNKVIKLYIKVKGGTKNEQEL